MLKILIPCALLCALACGGGSLGVAKKDVAAGNYQDAITALQTELQQSRMNVDAMVLLAECYEKTDRADSAVALYERALTVDAGNSAVTAKLTQLYITSGNMAREDGSLRQALEKYEKAEKLSSQAFEVFYQRGIAYQKFDYLDKAEIEFKQAAEISPDDPRLKTLQGEIAARAEQADQQFQQGFALYQKGKWDQAIEVLEQAVSLDASHKEAKYALHMARGRRFYKKGSVSAIWDAITEFGHASVLHPQSAEPIYFMAQSYEKKDRDDYDLTVETYRKVLELEPESGFAEKAKKRIEYLLDRKEKMEKFWGKKKN